MTTHLNARRLAVCLLLLLTGAPVQAQVLVARPPPAVQPTDADKERARAAYGEASAAYSDGRLEDAMRAAELAWQALPNASTALIRATILGDLSRDGDAFEAYLHAANLAPTPEEQSLVEAGLARHGARLSPALGWLIIRTTPREATATIDGTSFPTPQTIGAPAGEQRVYLQAPGFTTAEFVVSVRSGQGSVFNAALSAVTVPEHYVQPVPTGQPPSNAPAPSAVPPPAAPVKKKRPPMHQRRQMSPYLVFGVGGDVEVEIFGQADTSDMSAGGLGMVLDFPFRTAGALGLRIAFEGWNSSIFSDADLGPQLMFDFALDLRGRIPLGEVAELYVAVPVGLSIALLDNGFDSSGDPATEGAAGWLVGILGGAKIFIRNRWGIFVEGGWMMHTWKFDIDGLDFKITTRQPQVAIGLIFSL